MVACRFDDSDRLVPVCLMVASLPTVKLWLIEALALLMYSVTITDLSPVPCATVIDAETLLLLRCSIVVSLAQPVTVMVASALLFECCSTTALLALPVWLTHAPESAMTADEPNANAMPSAAVVSLSFIVFSCGWRQIVNIQEYGGLRHRPCLRIDR